MPPSPSTRRKERAYGEIDQAKLKRRQARHDGDYIVYWFLLGVLLFFIALCYYLVNYIPRKHHTYQHHASGNQYHQPSSSKEST